MFDMTSNLHARGRAVQFRFVWSVLPSSLSSADLSSPPLLTFTAPLEVSYYCDLLREVYIMWAMEEGEEGGGANEDDRGSKNRQAESSDDGGEGGAQITSAFIDVDISHLQLSLFSMCVLDSVLNHLLLQGDGTSAGGVSREDAMSDSALHQRSAIEALLFERILQRALSTYNDCDGDQLTPSPFVKGSDLPTDKGEVVDGAEEMAQTAKTRHVASAEEASLTHRTRTRRHQPTIAVQRKSLLCAAVALDFLGCSAGSGLIGDYLIDIICTTSAKSLCEEWFPPLNSPPFPSVSASAPQTNPQQADNNNATLPRSSPPRLTTIDPHEVDSIHGAVLHEMRSVQQQRRRQQHGGGDE